MGRKIFRRVYIILFFCITLVILSYSYAKKPIIEIEFKSTNYGEPLTLFFDNGMDSVFDDDHIKQYQIIETDEFQTAVFTIPVDAVKNLMIDFGYSSGDTEIKSIVIKKNPFLKKIIAGDEILQYFPVTNMITEYEASTYTHLSYEGYEAFIRSQYTEYLEYDVDIIYCLLMCMVTALTSLVLSYVINIGLKVLNSDFIRGLWINEKREEQLLVRETVREKRTLIFALLICFISHVLIITQLEGWLCADVEGYLSHAATFTGRDWSGVMRNANYFYSWGYSVLLAIPMVFTGDVIVVHYAAVIFHAILSCGILLICYDLAKRLFPNENRSILIWSSFAVSVYTTYIFQGAGMLSEMYLYFFVFLDIYLLYRYLETDKTVWGVLCSLAVGYTYIIHNRAIGIIVAYILVIILISAASRNWKRFLTLMVPLLLVLALNHDVLQFLDAHEKQGEIYDKNTYSGQVTRIKNKMNMYGVVSVIKCIVGECWYMLIGSFGIAAIGIYEVLKKIIYKVKKKEKYDNSLFWYLFLILILGGSLAVSVLSIAPSKVLDADARYDIFIYGRYWEAVFGIFILLGFLYCLQGLRKRVYINVILSGVILTGITEVMTREYKGNVYNFWGIPAVLTSLFNTEKQFNVMNSSVIGMIIMIVLFILILFDREKLYKGAIAIWTIVCVGFGSNAVYNTAQIYIGFSYAGSMPFYNDDFNGVCDYIRQEKIDKFAICAMDPYWTIQFQIAFPDADVLGIIREDQKDDTYDINVVDKALWPVVEYVDPLYENESYYIVRE